MKRMIFFILVLGLLLIAVGCAASKPEPEPEPEFLPDDGVFMFDGDRTYVANDVMLPLMVGNWKSADGRYEMSYDEEQALCIWLDGLCVLQTLGTYIHLEPGGPDYTELLLEDTNLTDEAGQVLREIAELGFEPSDRRGTMVLKLYDHKTAFSTETIVLEYQEALPPEEEQRTLGQRLTGVYRLVSEDTEQAEHIIQIHEIGGVLLIQNCRYDSDGTENIWLQEVWPEEEGALRSGEALSIHGANLLFQPDVYGYMDDSLKLTVTPTESGVRLTEGFLSYGEEIETETLDFARIEDESIFHASFAQMRQQLPEGSSSQPTGSWYLKLEQEELWLELEADGTLRLARKFLYTPLMLHVGVWSAEDDGTMHVVSDAIGDQDGLAYFELQWQLENGCLLLQQPEQGMLLPSNALYEWTPVEGDLRFSTDLLGDFKPAVEYASLGEGELLNPDTGDVLAYSYRVCRMEASLPGAQELNEALASGVETIIQQQLDAIYAGQMPEYHSIWCEPHNYAGYYSLVFTLERWVDGSIEYMVYYYDVWRGSQVDISEFLIPQGLDYFEDFLPAAVQAGQNYLLDSNQQLPEEFRAELEDALERTALYVGQYPTHAFIIPDGTIFAIVPVASMAGPDYIYLQLPVT